MRVYPLEDKRLTVGAGGILFHPKDRDQPLLMQWHGQLTPIDPKDGPKRFVEVIIERLLKEQRFDAVHDTNWVSVTAAVQRLVLDWNRELSIALAARMDADTNAGRSIDFAVGGEKDKPH